MSSERSSVAFLPTYANPYQHLLAEALAGYDVTVQLLNEMPDFRWLQANRSKVNILHLHWLYGLYMARYKTPLVALGFRRKLEEARRLGYHLVWTAHNLMPHRSRPQFFHRAMRNVILGQASAVITHCEYGRQELSRLFDYRGPIHVIPIGSYRGVYPAISTRSEARRELGLEPSEFVYLSLGNITSYKGLEGLVESFQEAAEPQDRLLIAGRNREPALTSRLESMSSAGNRIQIHGRTIPDAEMQRFLVAADVMVAPFNRILTSSSVMVGLSYGLPIITPRMGCMPELITEQTGLLYDPEVPGSLAAALQRIKSRKLNEMGTAAIALAESFEWAASAQLTARVYRDCLYD